MVKFTITESGTVENVEPVEGFCGDPQNPDTEFRPCTMFNSASSRAALKLKYKPKIVDGKLLLMMCFIDLHLYWRRMIRMKLNKKLFKAIFISFSLLFVPIETNAQSSAKSDQKN